MMIPNHFTVKRRRGSTFFDVVVGSMVLSVLLVPSFHLIAQSQGMTRRLADQELLLFEADQLMEQTKKDLSNPEYYLKIHSSPIDWELPSKKSLDDGRTMISMMRFHRDDSFKSAKLLSISASAYIDSNGNGNRDSNESSEQLLAQWAEPEVSQ